MECVWFIGSAATAVSLLIFGGSGVCFVVSVLLFSGARLFAEVSGLALVVFVISIYVRTQIEISSRDVTATATTEAL